MIMLPCKDALCAPEEMQNMALTCGQFISIKFVKIDASMGEFIWCFLCC